MKKQRPIQPPESYEHCRAYLSPEEFAKLDREMRRADMPLEAVPKFDFIPAFLDKAEAAALFDGLMRLPGFKFETGSCTLEACHLTVQYGPRQAYFDCVPEIYRVKSSGDIPPFLAAIQAGLEGKYDCSFNSCQINMHPDNTTVVHPHKDSNPGHICQISVGATREFVLTYHCPIFHKFARIPLTSGSLLTFFPKHQHRMQHEMPRSETPCGTKFSVIFRYIPAIITKKFIADAKSAAEADEIRRLRDEEYQAAQIAGREKRRLACA